MDMPDKTKNNDRETYRKHLIQGLCTVGNFLAIYCGPDKEQERLAREANQVAKMPLEDRHKILRFIIVKPLNLEAWR
jgi:hypothetical protein